MSNTKLDQLASDIVDEFLQTRSQNYMKQWTLQNTGGTVIIVISRDDVNKKVASQPSGQPCPLCGGSGRV